MSAIKLCRTVATRRLAFCVDGLVPEPRRSRAPLAGKLALVCHVLFLLMLRM